MLFVLGVVCGSIAVVFALALFRGVAADARSLAMEESCASDDSPHSGLSVEQNERLYRVEPRLREWDAACCKVQVQECPDLYADATVYPPLSMADLAEQDTAPLQHSVSI